MYLPRLASVLSVALVSLVILPASAQTIFGDEHLVSGGQPGAYEAIASDLDGDGDQDVLTADGVFSSGGMGWYENVDGLGNFGPRTDVALSDGAGDISATDIDGDGDLDLVARTINEIAWYENTDGFGDFGQKHFIIIATNGIQTTVAADLDGDGDQDVLWSSVTFTPGDHTPIVTVAWHENTDGLGSFGPAIDISITDVEFPETIVASDLDGDDDLDVLLISSKGAKIVWLENDGSGNFGPTQRISANFGFEMFGLTTDFDGDGDQDVLSASTSNTGDDWLKWWENTDGLGTFSHQPKSIDIISQKITSISAADLDGDGDQDVLATSLEFSGTSRISWYRNDGLGNFGVEHVIILLDDEDDTVFTAFATDLDGDGDLDVVGGFADKVVWVENETIVPAITIACSPVDAPIVIPDTGGTYAYDIDVRNTSSASQTFDLWFDVVGTDVLLTRGPSTRTLAPGESIVGTIDLRVPARAPPQDYEHICSVGAFPDADDNDRFGWEKLATPAVDLDGDGDAVMVSSSVNEGIIRLYENLTPAAVWKTGASQTTMVAAETSVAGEIPSSFTLDGSSPNPFNPTTTIRFGVPEPAQVRLVVYDILGREVARLVDGLMQPGKHEVSFDGSSLSSGTYLYRLETARGIFTRTMLLTK